MIQKINEVSGDEKMENIKEKLNQLVQDLNQIIPEINWFISSSENCRSFIITKFPVILDEFNNKNLQLLWRGTQDGFRASEFWKRCENQGNTLLLIKDSKENIFGGLTPSPWQSSPEY
jgi:hypothetical protein